MYVGTETLTKESEMNKEHKIFLNKAMSTISDLRHEADNLGFKEEELIFRVMRAVLYNSNLLGTFAQMCSLFAKKIFKVPCPHFKEYSKN